MTENIKKNFIETLTGSYDELSFSLAYLRKEVQNWNERFHQAEHINNSERVLVKKQYLLLSTEIERLDDSLVLFKSKLDLLDDNEPEENLNLLLECNRSFYADIRICYSMYASLMTCLNWQSPSVKSSLNSRIGLEREKVKTDWNDYKRDRSSDTFAIERMYKDQIFKVNSVGKDYVLNIFNSGMAAFTSIIYLITCENIIKNKIFASSQIYVESRMLLSKFFKDKITYFDFNETEKIVDKIFKEEPDVVFFEPISNTSILRLFDVKRVLSEVIKSYTKDIYFVVDVTCSLGFDDFINTMSLPKNIRILTHGSILKASQLGLERVNAGFVQAYNLGDLAEKVLDYRTLSGTNIQDFATYLLPVTSKEFLQKRMKIIESNATFLASSMLNLDPQKEIIDEVIYPGLNTHPDYELSKEIGFSGFFFNVKFIPKYNHDKFFEIYTSEVINIARKIGCDIVHGASFGFNMTSIYYSVGWDEPENHYIRISTGTETLLEVEKMKIVLSKALEAFKKRIEQI